MNQQVSKRLKLLASALIRPDSNGELVRERNLILASNIPNSPDDLLQKLEAFLEVLVPPAGDGLRPRRMNQQLRNAEPAVAWFPPVTAALSTSRLVTTLRWSRYGVSDDNDGDNSVRRPSIFGVQGSGFIPIGM